MKTVVECGIRGGAHMDNFQCVSIKQGQALAHKLAHIFGAVDNIPGGWKVGRGKPRITWQSGTHFVALSVLDGVARGPASSSLWQGAAS